MIGPKCRRSSPLRRLAVATVGLLLAAVVSVAIGEPDHEVSSNKINSAALLFHPPPILSPLHHTSLGQLHHLPQAAGFRSMAFWVRSLKPLSRSASHGALGSISSTAIALSPHPGSFPLAAHEPMVRPPRSQLPCPVPFVVFFSVTAQSRPLTQDPPGLSGGRGTLGNIKRSSVVSKFKCKVIQIVRLNCIQYHSKGHVDPVVRVELRLPSWHLFEFLRCDDGTHVHLCLSPVKHLRDLRLQALQPQVPCSWRQPEGSPAGQAMRTSEAPDRCNRRGHTPELFLGDTAGPRRLHLPLLLVHTEFDSQSELASSFFTLGWEWVLYIATPILNVVAQELQICNPGILQSLHSVLCFLLS